MLPFWRQFSMPSNNNNQDLFDNLLSMVGSDNQDDIYEKRTPPLPSKKASEDAGTHYEEINEEDYFEEEIKEDEESQEIPADIGALFEEISKQNQQPIQQEQPENISKIQSFIIDPTKPFNQQQPKVLPQQVINASGQSSNIQNTEYIEDDYYPEQPEEDAYEEKDTQYSVEKAEEPPKQETQKTRGRLGNRGKGQREERKIDVDENIGRNKKTSGAKKGGLFAPRGLQKAQADSEGIEDTPKSKKSGGLFAPRGLQKAQSENNAEASQSKQKKKGGLFAPRGLEKAENNQEQPARDENISPKQQDKLSKKGFPREYYDPTDREVDPVSGEEGFFFNIEKTLRKHNALFISKVIPIRVLDRMTYNKPFFDNYAVKQHEKTVQLNNSSAQDQYKYETKKKAIKIGSVIVVILAIFLLITMKILPDKKYEQAMTYYNEQSWDEAYAAFEEIINYRDSAYYAKFSEAMINLANREYDKATENFELLSKYQEYFDVSMEDMLSECKYQEAKHLVIDGDLNKAMMIFATIQDYKDSVDCYYRAGYRVAEKYAEAGETEKALDAFFAIKAYDDAQSRVESMASSMYEDAVNYYKSKNYEKASAIFSYLSKYSYKDCKAMVDQCTYRTGLNNYAIGKYEEARKCFEQVPKYKDSHAMYKECTYNIAKAKYATSIEDSLLEYSMIPEYRNVATILKQPVFLLYGSWQITEMKDNPCPVIDFTFNKGGLFQSEKQVQYVAISTAANPISYKWNGKAYATSMGGYTITAAPIDANTIKMTCSEPGKTTYFTCVRTKSFYDLINVDKQDEEIPEDEAERDEIITEIMQDFINKKLDGVITFNGKKYNAQLIIQQINERLGKE